MIRIKSWQHFIFEWCSFLSKYNNLETTQCSVWHIVGTWLVFVCIFIESLLNSYYLPRTTIYFTEQNTPNSWTHGIYVLLGLRSTIIKISKMYGMLASELLRRKNSQGEGKKGWEMQFQIGESEKVTLRRWHLHRDIKEVGRKVSCVAARRKSQAGRRNSKSKGPEVGGSAEARAAEHNKQSGECWRVREGKELRKEAWSCTAWKGIIGSQAFILWKVECHWRVSKRIVTWHDLGSNRSQDPSVWCVQNRLKQGQGRKPSATRRPLQASKQEMMVAWAMSVGVGEQESGWTLDHSWM